MIQVAKNLYNHRELMAVLTWKNVTLRYKQAYLGVAWAVVKPLTLMLIFTLVKTRQRSMHATKRIRFDRTRRW